MNIVLIGLSHKTAPVEVREQLAFEGARLPDALSNLVDQQAIDEGVIVSTCNRVELIASAPAGVEKGLSRLTDFLCDFHRLPFDAINNHLYLHADTAAVKHLFRVASSLDSMVVGESQILGQVKDAYRSAVEAGTVGRVLSQLMHRAISVAKRVRTDGQFRGGRVGAKDFLGAFRQDRPAGRRGRDGGTGGAESDAGGRQ
jgi:glutamyl-tRNA reductase